MENRRKVSYFYDVEVGQFYYGQNHPMKPHRVRMAHDLIARYGLYKQMQVFKPNLAALSDMAAFHEEDYLEFLRNASGSTSSQMAFKADLNRFNLAGDCPVFDGLFRYCQIYSGASIGGAVKLNYNESDIVINWAGGLHHAKKSEASGFCYVNDIVLAILELLKYKQRVVYVDIDIHHGDGVEEAFLTTDRVLTVSFHKFGGDFFPGTGDITNVGAGLGTYYKVNVPLEDGMDDESFEFLFKPIMERVMAQYQPEAIVMQSGADSLTGDRLGVFNLSIKGHAACHKYMMSFGVPMLVLGGGGYKIKNVARCWTYETAVLLGVDDELPDELPPNEYYEYFGPDFSLHIPTDPTRPNKNSRESLEQVRNAVLENLKLVRPVSVGIHERPPDGIALENLANISLNDHNAAASGHAHTQQLWKPPPKADDLNDDIDLLASDDSFSDD